MSHSVNSIGLEKLVGEKFIFANKNAEKIFEQITSISSKGDFSIMAVKLLPAVKTSTGGIGDRQEIWEMEIQDSKGRIVNVTSLSGGPGCAFPKP